MEKAVKHQLMRMLEHVVIAAEKSQSNLLDVGRLVSTWLHVGERCIGQLSSSSFYHRPFHWRWNHLAFPPSLMRRPPSNRVQRYPFISEEIQIFLGHPLSSETPINHFTGGAGFSTWMWLSCVGVDFRDRKHSQVSFESNSLTVKTRNNNTNSR